MRPSSMKGSKASNSQDSRSGPGRNGLRDSHQLPLRKALPGWVQKLKVARYLMVPYLMFIMNPPTRTPKPFTRPCRYLPKPADNRLTDKSTTQPAMFSTRESRCLRVDSQTCPFLLSRLSSPCTAVDLSPFSSVLPASSRSIHLCHDPSWSTSALHPCLLQLLRSRSWCDDSLHLPIRLSSSLQYLSQISKRICSCARTVGRRISVSIWAASCGLHWWKCCCS